MGFTHFDSRGHAKMVDVANKASTYRTAVAKGKVQMSPCVASDIAQNHNIAQNQVLEVEGADMAWLETGKGDVLGIARIAGIQAAKRTHELIPLCHALAISSVQVDFICGDRCVEITATVSAVDRTGVEMEALTACSVAALTIYDMCKASDKAITITDIMLWKKTGGRSGEYSRV